MLDVFAHLFTKKPKIRTAASRRIFYKVARHYGTAPKSKRKPLFSLDELTGEPDGRLLAVEVIQEVNETASFCMDEMNLTIGKSSISPILRIASYAMLEVTGNGKTDHQHGVSGKRACEGS